MWGNLLYLLHSWGITWLKLGGSWSPTGFQPWDESQLNVQDFLRNYSTYSPSAVPVICHEGQIWVETMLHRRGAFTVPQCLVHSNQGAVIPWRPHPRAAVYVCTVTDEWPHHAQLFTLCCYGDRGAAVTIQAVYVAMVTKIHKQHGCNIESTSVSVRHFWKCEQTFGYRFTSGWQRGVD